MSALAPERDLAGRVALTGGSRGLGAATCERLGAVGKHVAIGGRDAGAVERVPAIVCQHGVRALPAVGDTSDEVVLEALRARIEQELGPVHVLALFPGGDGAAAPITVTALEDWQATLDANLTATFLALKVFLPGMIARGAGSVITMASTAARPPHLPPTRPPRPGSSP
jgi:3-oxoacyl-[acyl-carrier protein] reductase